MLGARIGLVAVALAAFPGAAAGQDFRALEETRPPDPAANAIRFLAPAVVPVPRVLLAGDSWAQYMWDDGSHNDVFDRFGQGDHRALGRSLGSDPGPGYTGPEYAISGSEARQWADTANYPWIANLVFELEANPTVDLVVLSIGGNDVLAGKPGGGWYKDMDLDVPGSEAAFFDRLEDDTFAIVSAVLAVRPEIRVLLSSYDYPNFNVGFWCFVYACPKRRDLSRDPVNDLITDEELNDMMVRIEERRIAWSNANPRLLFDHAVGLMHHWYGDGISPPGALPPPGQVPPLYAPFPGGNPLRPTLRANFRKPGGIDADPIHLNYAGYQYKIANETATTFFPAFRGEAAETFTAPGGNLDGWTDGTAAGTSGIRLGDGGPAPYHGIVTFDTGSIPDGATITRAAFYLVRSASSGGNPFTSGALGTPVVDVARGSFGAPEVEVSDAFAPADVVDAGAVVGSALADRYALRIEIAGAGLAAINDEGLTQFRIRFPAAGGGAGADYVEFKDGEAASFPPGFPNLADYMGSPAPFLDVDYEVPTGIADGGAGAGAPRLLAASPNPFRASTTLRYVLAEPARVSLAVFDLQGRLVRTLVDEERPGGTHQAVWDGRNGRGARAASGIYLARLAAGGLSSATRILLLH